jgi:hypothetical protein
MWREVLSWQIHPEEPETVAFAQQPTFVGNGSRTQEYYALVTYDNEEREYKVELGDARGMLITTHFYIKENARERWRTYLSQYDMEVETNNWDSYE